MAKTVCFLFFRSEKSDKLKIVKLWTDPKATLNPNLIKKPVFSRDDVFGLRNFMQKPFSQMNLIREERIVNYRVSLVRGVSENAFGILANRFHVMLTTMRLCASSLPVSCFTIL